VIKRFYRGIDFFSTYYFPNNEGIIVAGNVVSEVADAGIRTGECRFVSVVGNSVINSNKYGIIVGSASEDVVVVGNVVEDLREPVVTVNAVIVYDAKRVLIANNRFGRIYGTGIYVTGPASDQVYIYFNNVQLCNLGVGEHAIDYVAELAGKVFIKGNIGYPTENSGVATIVAGSTRVTVSHGLKRAPSKVLVTPYANIRVWVENITGTSFDIVTDTAPATDVQVAWYAEV
jgi:hypothetical protein